ncbi:DNA polymerase III, chi subunit [Noviherbaspirillum humi]|uniref:DNA polymerase III, chi subunit n=1 Tax=Noviherbaspirillum humi TaxID=1688639 RepID=A0A239IXD6_9BURK|nr:DNA polymerase III subunit chi [Noviherbaspirillum humi]SNS98280.1 DNA polymerase III, chi subunit [Noviherbaspirillum humi]
MTRIDFHSNVPDKLLYACRLVRKARGANFQVVVLAQDAPMLNRFDELLWTFSDLDFLPHAQSHEPHAAMTPIILTADDEAELPHRQILVNLSDRTPAAFASFERMFEIVSSEENDRALGRERYRYYKDRGYPLTHFIAEQS